MDVNETLKPEESQKLSFKKYANIYGEGFSYYPAQLVISIVVCLVNIATAISVPGIVALEFILAISGCISLGAYIKFKYWWIPSLELAVAMTIDMVKVGAYDWPLGVGGLFIISSIYVSVKLFKLNKQYKKYLAFQGTNDAYDEAFKLKIDKQKPKIDKQKEKSFYDMLDDVDRDNK